MTGSRYKVVTRTGSPLTNTPNYPDYTSGANKCYRCITRTLSLIFGKDEMSFTVTSGNPKSEQKARKL